MKSVKEWKTLDICEVEKDNKWVDIGPGEITMDSAAEESVCPEEWAMGFATTPPIAGQEMNFRNASGGKMKHLGSRDVIFKAENEKGSNRKMGMKFQVSEVRKPLAAVARVTEMGNKVQFGPKPEDNFVQNVETGEKIPMRQKGRSYVIDVNFIMKQQNLQQVFHGRAM